MKKTMTTLALVVFIATNTFAKTTSSSEPKRSPTERYLSGVTLESHTERSRSESITFTENKGQVHDQNYNPRPDVLYSTMAGDMVVHIKKTGLSYQLYRLANPDRVAASSENPVRVERERKLVAESSHITDQQTHSTSSEHIIYRIDLTWLNANVNFTKAEDEALSDYSNYYLENCPMGALNVKSYKGIRLNGLYKGIDLHYYEKNGDLKHDYIVAPNANYKQIQLQVDGADISINKDGSLILTTPLGKIQEGAPIVFQNGKQLKAKWIVKKNTLSFEVEDYNPNYELIIDPVTRLWGTYYGGSGAEYSLSCATDVNGNVYITGNTGTGVGTAIATVGSHQSVYNANGDAFLVKFNASGNRQWGTYYGGPGGETGKSCTTDASGNVFMTGVTTSTTGSAISSVGSHQFANGGGTGDVFLAKFDANGVRLWGTYYGGTSYEEGNSCATDGSGNVYLAGYSTSSNGTQIATIGSFQSAFLGSGHAFLAKFNANGVRQWGTYYGGTGNSQGSGCTVDVNNNVYLTGFTSTNSGTAVATVGSHQSTYGGGIDAFLVKFDANGSRLWGTYYGGTLTDNAYSCSTDAQGNIYMVGKTASNVGTAIATGSSHQSVIGGGDDGFLVKFSNGGTRQWGSYYGGTGEDVVRSCNSDVSGIIYIAGFTDSNSGTFIASAGGFQIGFGGGLYDAFLAKFTVNGVRLSGTYYGGTGLESGLSCATDGTGNVYMTGTTDTNSGTTMASTSSYQTTIGGSNDAYLVKFACSNPDQPLAISGSTIMCSGSSANTYSITSVLSATSYTWSLPSNWSGTSNTASISATPGTTGIFTVSAVNACGVSPQQTLNVTVNPLPVVTATTSNVLLCIGESATLSAGGASNYTFNPGGSGASITVTPNITTTYTITGTDTNGCSNTAVVTQSVDECTGLDRSQVPLSVVEVFPNPTKGLINLKLNADYEITILNAIGQIVYSSKLNSGSHQIDLNNFENGMYVLKLEGGIHIKKVKIVKSN